MRVGEKTGSSDRGTIGCGNRKHPEAWEELSCCLPDGEELAALLLLEFSGNREPLGQGGPDWDPGEAQPGGQPWAPGVPSPRGQEERGFWGGRKGTRWA